MKPFNKKIQFIGAAAVLLGIAGAGLLTADPVPPPDASTVARARAAFLKRMSSRRPLMRGNVTTPPPSASVTGGGSYNWSGFADVEGGSNKVSSVSGEWEIPAVQCPVGNYQYSDAFDAQWVGIDGAINGTVEQLGSATQCYEGVEYYYVWYEMYPAGTIVEGSQACLTYNVDCPEPGDRIAASVTATPAGNYTLSLIDFTHPADSFTVTASCPPSTCLDSSGEWIMERPATYASFGVVILPLGDFFETSFSNGTLTSGGKTTTIENFKDGPIYDFNMYDDTESYWLDCVGQQNFGWGGGNPKLLLTTNANSCPTVTPYHGSFSVSFDASF
jgi:Peptidase A4 family